MIGHKLPNKMKSDTVAEPKLFHQLNNPSVVLQLTDAPSSVPVVALHRQ
jgi:hypothetical protein